jgi:hypothetical protein
VAYNELVSKNLPDPYETHVFDSNRVYQFSRHFCEVDGTFYLFLELSVVSLCTHFGTSIMG